MLISRIKMVGFGWLSRQHYFLNWLSKMKPHEKFFIALIGTNGKTDV